MKTSMKTLMGIFAFMMMANFTSAQYVANDNSVLGDGDNPYVGTKYTYTITPGNAANAKKWLVFDDANKTAITDPSKFSIDGDDDLASVKITWNTPGTYYLTYRETLNSCITYRGVVVVVTDNDFYLTMSADGEACNSEVNNVLDWTVYKDKTDVKTRLTYQIEMNKNADFDFTTWEFTGTFTLASGLSIADAADVIVTDGTKTNGASNATFSVSAPEANGIVTITVDVSGKVTTGGDVVLTLSNGAAVQGSVSVVDNTTLPLEADQPNADLRDRSQKQVLKALPAATNIRFN